MNEDQPRNSQSRWQHLESEYQTWRYLAIEFCYKNVLLTTLIISVILLVIYHYVADDPLKSLLLGIIGSLLASNIFTAASKNHEKYALKSANEDLVNKNIKMLEPRLDKLTENASSYIKNVSDTLSLKIDCLPDRVFEASRSSSIAFEKHLLSSVSKSNKIVFKGVSALFHTKRLISLFESSEFNNNKNIQILLLNPYNDSLLLSHESFRLHYQNEGGPNGIDIEARAKKLKKEILTVMFKLCAITDTHRCNLDVRFHNELAVSRVEIFDDGIYLSYYDKGMPFPGTQYFNKASKVYDSYHTNLTYYFENQYNPDFSLIHYSPGNKFESAVARFKFDRNEAHKLLLDFENLVEEKERNFI